MDEETLLSIFRDIDSEKAGYCIKGEWRRKPLCHYYYGALIESPIDRIWYWAADIQTRYAIESGLNVILDRLHACIRCQTTDPGISNKNPYCISCIELIKKEEAERLVRASTIIPPPLNDNKNNNNDANPEDIDFGKETGYLRLDEGADDPVWHWVKEYREFKPISTRVKTAFDKAGLCIRCKEPTPGIEVDDPYCKTCISIVHAGEKEWASYVLERKRLRREEESRLAGDGGGGNWKPEEEKKPDVEIKTWKDASKVLLALNKKKENAKIKREKEKAKKSEHLLIKQPETGRLKKISKTIIEYEKKKGTLDNIIIQNSNKNSDNV